MRFFPYERPYDAQREAMDRIHNALGRSQDVLFEGACGTGKTLAALAPALDVARDRDKTVVITTNVHQQMRQFVADASAIAETEPIRAVVFRGKTDMCHIDVGYEECRSLRETTRDFVDAQTAYTRLQDRERELLEAARAGDATAAEARGAVADELAEVREALGELREATRCSHYEANLTTDTDAFFEWLFADVRRPEEIYRRAEESGWCGYELLKEGLEGVDLAVCNYHHLLNPETRGHFFRWLGRDPDEVIAVFDEAHNLEGAAREHASRTLTERTLEAALDELERLDGGPSDALSRAGTDHASGSDDLETGRLDDSFGVEESTEPDPTTGSDSGVGSDSGDDERPPVEALSTDPIEVEGTDRARNVVAAFRDALVDTYEAGLGFGERERLGGRWRDVAVANEDRRDDLTLAFLDRYAGSGIRDDLAAARSVGEALERAYETAYRRGETPVRATAATGRVADFLAAWLETGTDPGTYPVVGVRRHGATDEVYGRAELYTCLPRSVTGGLLEDLHASVLMSATLQPFDVTADVLGMGDPVTLAYGLQFPPANRRTLAVGTPPLFARDRDDSDVQASVTEALRDAVRFTPGNVLVYCPSYGEAERYATLLDRFPADGGAAESTGTGLERDGVDGDGVDDDSPDGDGPDWLTTAMDADEAATVGGDTHPSAGGSSGESTAGESSPREARPSGGLSLPDRDDPIPIYLDRPGESSEPVRRSFVASDRAVALTSLWGPLTEGVSFDGDDAHAVVVLGVPYPRVDDRLQAIQDAYDAAFAGEDVGWRYAVEIPTIRRTRQALGRVVRSPDEIGARMLIDRRYTAAGAADLGKYSVHGTFPPEERDELVDVDPAKLPFALRNFFAEHDAYDGEPPAP